MNPGTDLPAILRWNLLRCLIRRFQVPVVENTA